MSIEVGNVIPGKVTGITNLEFFRFRSRETGLVHISEVSDFVHPRYQRSFEKLEPG